ncbi:MULTISPECIES: hypothetical protein [Halolamina]|uniref:Uncharacterized protein n=1 Tax=Halolamina pelagica TaxID=699431 RepID=A0A1I5PZE0_9EURY|nr:MULTISPECIES: hypothetical protein [Halolamina]NHX35015.1 hypothetical protein [Halolamina sp. R1-12]SFP39140.1 hypothetical protein SAMN05216277_103172 [Halolamina pelagica]
MVPGIVPDLLLGLLALAAFDAVALLPVLLSSAVRRLGRRWPTGSLGANYLLATTAFATTHLTAIMAAVALHGGSLEQDVLRWVAGITLANALLWWLAVAVVLPMRGVWEPKTEGEYDGRIALTVGLVGYAVATGVALLVIVVVAIAFYAPW